MATGIQHPISWFLLDTQYIQDNRADPSSTSKKSVPRYTIRPHSVLGYAWDFPANRDKKIVIGYGNYHRSIDIMEIGDLVPFKFDVGVLKTAMALIAN